MCGVSTQVQPHLLNASFHFILHSYVRSSRRKHCRFVAFRASFWALKSTDHAENRMKQKNKNHVGAHTCTFGTGHRLTASWNFYPHAARRDDVHTLLQQTMAGLRVANHHSVKHKLEFNECVRKRETESIFYIVAFGRRAELICVNISRSARCSSKWEKTAHRADRSFIHVVRTYHILNNKLLFFHTIFMFTALLFECFLVVIDVFLFLILYHSFGASSMHAPHNRGTLCGSTTSSSMREADERARERQRNETSIYTRLYYWAGPLCCCRFHFL